MKKLVIPIILAVILGIGGGIAAVTINRSNIAAADITEVSNDLLKLGKYYLDGDVSTNKWVEVTPDYISLKGSDMDEWLVDAGRKVHEENNISITDEELRAMLGSTKKLYCDEKIYQLQYVGMEEKPYVIKVDRDNIITDREELLKTNAGFPFNDKTNTIKLAVGDFTLVE